MNILGLLNMHQGMLLRGILFLKQVGKKEGGKKNNQEVNGHQQKTEHENGRKVTGVWNPLPKAHFEIFN